MGVRPEDCRSIFSQGNSKLRRFLSITKEGHVLRLADEPPQPTISVRISDLIVLQEDCEKFQAAWELGHCTDKPNMAVDLICSNDYRHVIIDGLEFHLGDMQARVIQLLHDAARSRNPWIHIKTLVYECQSNAGRMRDIFKHQPHWRKLMASNGRGYYRLNVPLEQFQDKTAAA